MSKNFTCDANAYATRCQLDPHLRTFAAVSTGTILLQPAGTVKESVQGVVGWEAIEINRKSSRRVNDEH